MQAHVSIFCVCANAHDQAAHEGDRWIYAALNRSAQHVSGFSKMVCIRNPSCAIGILRMQLDTLLRLFALTLVEDRSSFLRQVLSGVRLDKMDDRHGNRMNDKYLVSEYERKGCTWVRSVYDMLCEFGHMSRKAVHTTYRPTDEQNIVELKFAECDEDWNERAMNSAISTFSEITFKILELVHE
jgi:hypothetical protein